MLPPRTYMNLPIRPAMDGESSKGFLLYGDISCAGDWQPKTHSIDLIGLLSELEHVTSEMMRLPEQEQQP
jgi:hypothetical protein